MRVMAFDPGGTTGWAIWDKDVNPTINTGQIGPHEHHNELDFLLGLQHTADMMIIFEAFEFFKDKNMPWAVKLISREYIGVIKRFAQERNVPLRKQEPGGIVPGSARAQSQVFWNDAKIKKLGLWSPGNPHAMDALRHLLYWRLFTYGDKSLLEDLK